MQFQPNRAVGPTSTVRDVSSPTDTPILPRLLTAKQASDYLNLPRTLIVSKAIGAVTVGRHTRYDRLAIDAFIDAESGMPMLGGHEQDEADAALERFDARFN